MGWTLIVAAGLLAGDVPRDGRSTGETDDHGLACLQGAWGAPLVVVESRQLFCYLDSCPGIRIRGDQWIHAKPKDTVWRITLDTSRTPWALDLRDEKGKVVWRGICEVTGDRLRVCLGTGARRPGTFDAGRHAQAVLFLYQREKK
jgi:uncharacterized protein (TIGR03067 family)